jgi:hypothetical protein
MSEKSNPVFNLEMFLPNYQEITERARKALVRTDVTEEMLTREEPQEDNPPEAGTYGADEEER